MLASHIRILANVNKESALEKKTPLIRRNPQPFQAAAPLSIF